MLGCSVGCVKKPLRLQGCNEFLCNEGCTLKCGALFFDLSAAFDTLDTDGAFGEEARSPWSSRQYDNMGEVIPHRPMTKSGLGWM
jgi:hypothetical protein